MRTVPTDRVRHLLAVDILPMALCIHTDFRHGLLAKRRGDLLGEFDLNFYYRPIDERGLRASPLNSFGIERNYIPEGARVTATVWLRGGQLLIQLSGDKVILIPELLDPGI